MPMRFEVGAHVNGQAIKLEQHNNVHQAATAAESFFVNNRCTKAWVFDRLTGRFAQEKIEANEDFGMPERQYRCVWERRSA